MGSGQKKCSKQVGYCPAWSSSSHPCGLCPQDPAPLAFVSACPACGFWPLFRTVKCVFLSPQAGPSWACCCHGNLQGLSGFGGGRGCGLKPKNTTTAVRSTTTARWPPSLHQRINPDSGGLREEVMGPTRCRSCRWPGR